jgi:uncharacterized membrane protein YczE
MMLAATPDAPVARKLGTLAVGLLLVASGVALMIRAELGVAPWDVLNTGLAKAAGVDIGVAAMVLPFVVTLLGWTLGRRPGPGTVLAVLLVGPMLSAILHQIPHQEALATRVAFFAVAFVVIAAGITAVIIAEFGPGPAEMVMLAIHDRGYPLAASRTAIELVCVSVGWAIGGQVGVGTVAVAVLLGPTLRRMLTAAGFDAVGNVDEASDCAAPGA